MTQKSIAMCAVLLTGVVACSDEEPCSVREQNAWVKSTLEEWYLENDQIPNLSPSSFDSPQDFLAALVRDVDLAPNSSVQGRDRFSRVFGVAVERNLVRNVSSGVGLLMEVDGTGVDGVFRILDVYGTFDGENPSPASEAGLERGDAITTYDGLRMDDVFVLSDLEGRKFIFGFDIGEAHELGIRKLNGDRTVVTLTGAEVTPTSVPIFRTFQLGDEEVGYVMFRDFDFASVEGLRKAFEFFEGRNVTKVIVDQRYNLGGFVFVVDYLANLLLGRDLGGTDAVLRAESWNRDKSEFNVEVNFSAPSCPSFLGNNESLKQYDCQGDVVGLTGVTDLVFINSGNTASASEVVLNSMLPHVDVGIVGSRSVGKPVGSAAFPATATGESDVCGLVMRAINFRNVNADGQGDYFDGFVPDCAASDDASFALGAAEEESIAAALHYLEHGECPRTEPSNGLTAEPLRRTPLDAERSFSYENSLARMRDQGRGYK